MTFFLLHTCVSKLIMIITKRPMIPFVSNSAWSHKVATGQVGASNSTMKIPKGRAPPRRYSFIRQPNGRKERRLEFTESPSYDAGNERRGRHADDLKYGRIDTHSSSHIYYAYMLTKIHIYIHANMWINGMKIFRGLVVSSLFFPFF